MAFRQVYVSDIQHVTENSSFRTIYKSSVSPSFAYQIMSILLILCFNGSLVTRTVVSSTAAKFEPHIFRRSDFVSSYAVRRFASQVKDKITLRLAVYRQSIRLGAEPLETHGQIFFSELNNLGHSSYITSQTRRWFCRFQLLLALASIFVLGSESRGTLNHILLFSDSRLPICRLLQLAGLQWRYSSPPPHGKDGSASRYLQLTGHNYNISVRTA
jgi:hypothetical protein